MQVLWVIVYGWVTGIALVIVLILYGFDFLLHIMKFVAHLLGASHASGSPSPYTVLYVNSFFRGKNADGTARRTSLESSSASSSSDDDDEGKDDGGDADGDARGPSTHKGTTRSSADTADQTAEKKRKKKKKDSHHSTRLFGKVKYDHARSLREQGLEGTTGRTATVQPLKLSSTCTLSWFNPASSTFGAPVECRLLLVGRVITVYELLLTGNANTSAGGSAGSGGGKGGGSSSARNSAADGSRDSVDAGVSRAEHMKGKIHTACITSKELKKFNKDPGSATPFTGRVLVVSSTDGEALLAPRDVDLTAAASVGSSSSFQASSFATGSPANASPSAQTPAKAQRTDSKRDSESRRSTTNGAGSGSGGGGLMTSWQTVIIKFRTARDSERWFNLLSGLAEADAWRQFAKSMPNPDTINTFLSRFFFQNMRDGNGIDDAIKKLIRKQLVKVSEKKFPRDLQGELKLDDFIIGTSIPWVSDVSDPAVSTNGEVGFDFNILYKGLDGGLELFFRLALQYRGIRVPHVWFSVKLLELEGTAHISIGPPPSKKFWIGGHKPPVVRLEVHQGCASGSGLLHRILTSLPDLSGIFTNLIKLYLFSDMILPVMDDFPLPNLANTPKSSPREAKKRTFDRKRAAQHSAAPALTGAFTREQLQQVERLFEMSQGPGATDTNKNHDGENPSPSTAAATEGEEARGNARPYWRPLSDETSNHNDDEGDTVGGGGDRVDSKLARSHRREHAPPASKTVSFPTELPGDGSAAPHAASAGLSASTRAARSTRAEAQMNASLARASTHSSRDVLLASAQNASMAGSGLGPSRSSDLGSRSSVPAPGLAAGEGDAGSPLAGQRAIRPTTSRSVRSLLKVKGDELSKASVVRRKVKKEKE